MGVIHERACHREIGQGRIDDPHAFLKWTAGKALIVTGRYHTVTLCVLTRTPFLYLESNTPKTTALVADVGLRTERKIEPEDLENSGNGESVLSRSRFSDTETRAIATFLSDNEARFEEMKGSIRALLQTASR